MEKGKAFDGIFAWRMVLLFGFGMINSAFFQGDILSIYAALGLLLIPLTKLNNKLILGLAIFLVLQPLEWFHLLQAMQNPTEKLANPESWTYFGKMNEYIKGPSFWDTAWGNLTNGKKAVLIWNAENGRFFSILGLFLVGFLMGQKQLFVWSDKSKRFWISTTIVAITLFFPLFFIQRYSSTLIESDAIRRPFDIIFSSYANFCFMFFLVGGIVLLYQTKIANRVLNVFAPIGKMSLSNYVFQSVVGSSIYYGFGLALYQYTGATYSLLIGIVLSVLFGLGCTWWAKRFKHGPLEGIWHKATWVWSK